MIIILTCGFKISECLDVLLGSLHLRCWVGGFPFPKRTLDNWIKGILLLRRLHHHVLQLTYSVSFPTGCKVPSSKVNACYCPNSQLQAELSHELQIRQKPDLEQRGSPKSLAWLAHRRVCQTLRLEDCWLHLTGQGMWAFQIRTQKLTS